MSFRSPLVLSCCLAAFSLMAPSVQASVTARDIRTTIRTQWEFQPGQGPRPIQQRDFFAPPPSAASTLSTEPYAISLPQAQPQATASTEPYPALTVTNEPYAAGHEPEVPQDLPPPLPVVQDDWRNPPRAQDAVIPKTRRQKLETPTSVEAGLQGSAYHYEETSLGVLTEGEEVGVNVVGQAAFGDGWFVRGDARLSFGQVDYKGSGTSEDEPNHIAEVRATIGRDLIWNSFALSPYIGIGYRYLNNDGRGDTSTGAWGYVRRSQYLFAPIGLQPRMMFPNGDILSVTAEFDPLLRGWQDSLLSTTPGYPDLHNPQKGGYGVHGDVMYKTGNWSFGPFLNYWNINQSEIACAAGTYYYGCGYEPHNHTVEAGLQFRYQLYQQE
ncbi:MAG: autotransporter domain-containing protein [Alphaproteobacteria bacterium]|nr:autotransporter domain-containing protein [Alphaproteobacteria bacterium]